MKWTPIALLVVLAACEPAGQTPQSAVSSPTPPLEIADANTRLDRGGLITSSEQLVGEYRVAGVQGQAVDLPYAITASIRPARIHVVADCVNLAWDYRLVDGILTTAPAAVESCGRGLAPIEATLAATLDGADRIVRTPANGFEVTGSGRSATLFRQ